MPGGFGIVGESGPELVNLPAGTRVFSNGELRQMLSDQSAILVEGPFGKMMKDLLKAERKEGKKDKIPFGQLVKELAHVKGHRGLGDDVAALKLTVQHHAKGTRNHTGGLALLGEGGIEGLGLPENWMDNFGDTISDLSHAKPLHPFGQLVKMLAHLRNAARKLAHDEAKMAHNKVKISPQLDRKMSNNERSGRKSNINIPSSRNR